MCFLICMRTFGHSQSARAYLPMDTINHGESGLMLRKQPAANTCKLQKLGHAKVRTKQVVFGLLLNGKSIVRSKLATVRKAYPS